MPTGVFLISTLITATTVADADRATVEAARWRAVGEALRDVGENLLVWDERVPTDIRRMMRALQRGDADSGWVQTPLTAMVHWSIQSLGDDDVPLNGVGAEAFLRVVGQPAAPLLEVAAATGDRQKQSAALGLLMACREVSDRSALAEAWVEQMSDDACVWPPANGARAFHLLSQSDRLLRMATPSLLAALEADDPQLRVNAAQLLCLAGANEHADQIVGTLAPLLDDDGLGETASLVRLGLPVASALRTSISQRDAQGRHAVGHVLGQVAGPNTSGALNCSWGCGLSWATDHPTLDASKIRFLGARDGLLAAPSHDRYVGASAGRWRDHRRFRDMVWNSEEPEAVAAQMARCCAEGVTEPTARALVRLHSRWLGQRWHEAHVHRVLRHLDRLLLERGAANPDPRAFCDDVDPRAVILPVP